MRFNLVDFAAFDIHILARPGAADDFVPKIVEQAAQRFAGMDNARKSGLAKNVVFGLPGAAESFSLDDVRQHLAEYSGISAAQLR